MTWLFGDSSASTLQINYIDFLRLALDFAVEVLGAEDALASGREQRRKLQSDTDAEMGRLDAFGAAVARTVRPRPERVVLSARSVGKGVAVVSAPVENWTTLSIRSVFHASSASSSTCVQGRVMCPPYVRMTCQETSP